jgi:hypothetical protein
LDHSSVVTTGRYVTSNLHMRREALGAFWKHAGLRRVRAQALATKVRVARVLEIAVATRFIWSPKTDQGASSLAIATYAPDKTELKIMGLIWISR